MNRTLMVLVKTSVVLVATFATMGPTGHVNAAESHCADPQEQAFLTLINDHRAASGLVPLAMSETLNRAADTHSQDMASNNFLGHTGTDGSSPKDRLVAAGYTYDTYWAENVHGSSETAQGAFDAWRNSAGHNANMLGANYVAIGVARSFNAGSDYGWYWTTVFGGVADATACLDDAVPDDPGDVGGQEPDEAEEGNDEGGEGDRPDTDGDGLYDDDETDVYDTDPNAADTDDDGVDDGAEVFYETDPLDSFDTPDPEDMGDVGDGGDDDGVDDPDTAASECADPEEQALLDLINRHRGMSGQDLLALSGTLSMAAHVHATDMATTGTLGHTGSNGSSPKDRLVAAGYTYDTYWAENVFQGGESAQDAFDWWTASPAHDGNMRSPNYLAIGIARVVDPATNDWFWATTFGGVADAEGCIAGEAPTAPGGGTDEGDSTEPDPGTESTVGADDGTEVSDGTDPPDSSEGPGTEPTDPGTDSSPEASDRPDSDADGLYDDDETDLYGTDPDNPDTDGDDVDDGTEVFNGTDPTDENG